MSDQEEKVESVEERRARRRETVAEVRRSARKIHEIVKYPHPVLSKPAEPVTEFGPELEQLVEEMFDSMYAAQGIGLAAPQIGISKQITVIDVSFKDDPDAKLVFINPQIIDEEGSSVEEEGCLSLPDIHLKVERPRRVKVRAFNEKGEPFEVEDDELLGRAMQHEIDHLHGILFIDRVSRLKREMTLRRIQKLQKLGEW